MLFVRLRAQPFTLPDPLCKSATLLPFILDQEI